MVDTHGNALPYAAGTTSRPLPIHDPTAPHVRAEHKPRPAGLDWDAHTPTCQLCTQKSGQIDHTGLCPACRGVASTTPSTAAGQVGGGRHGNVQMLDEQQVTEKFTAPTSTPPTLAMKAARASNQVEELTTPVSIVRAKVRQTSPDGILITLRGDGLAHRQTEIAALLQDLLAGLNQTPVVAAPAAGNPLDRQPATTGNKLAPRTGKGKSGRGASTSQRGRTGGKGGTTGRLVGHDAAIIQRYKDGDSCKTISDDYGCTPNAVRYLLKRNNVALLASGESQRGRVRPESRTLTADQERAIAAEYADGYASMADLADTYGCSERLIRDVLRRLNVETRKAGQRTKPRTTPDTTLEGARTA